MISTLDLLLRGAGLGAILVIIVLMRRAGSGSRSAFAVVASLLCPRRVCSGCSCAPGSTTASGRGWCTGWRWRGWLPCISGATAAPARPFRIRDLSGALAAASAAEMDQHHQPPPPSPRQGPRQLRPLFPLVGPALWYRASRLGGDFRTREPRRGQSGRSRRAGPRIGATHPLPSRAALRQTSRPRGKAWPISEPAH